MSRTLHWTLLSGCAALISLFTPLAWNSLQVFRLAGETASLQGMDTPSAAVEAESQELALNGSAVEMQSAPGRP